LASVIGHEARERLQSQVCIYRSRFSLLFLPLLNYFSSFFPLCRILGAPCCSPLPRLLSLS
jgi:hypothetical protein